MAKKTIVVCDKCGTEIPEIGAPEIKLTLDRASIHADLCNGCATELSALIPNARRSQKRGRKPVAVAA